MYHTSSLAHSPTAFDWQPRTRLVFGPGTLARVGEIASQLGGKRVLIVSDKGLVATGYVDRAQAAIKNAGLNVAVYDKVHENPTTLDVAECVEVARTAACDLI